MYDNVLRNVHCLTCLRKSFKKLSNFNSFVQKWDYIQFFKIGSIHFYASYFVTQANQLKQYELFFLSQSHSILQMWLGFDTLQTHSQVTYLQVPLAPERFLPHTLAGLLLSSLLLETAIQITKISGFDIVWNETKLFWQRIKWNTSFTTKCT